MTSNDSITLEQYELAKKRYPRHLLFFRVGADWRIYNDDAIVFSELYDLKHIWQCNLALSVPDRLIGEALSHLLRTGYPVAVCDKVAEPGRADPVPAEC